MSDSVNFQQLKTGFANTTLFFLAVVTVYIGGFIYDEVGPLVYGLSLAILASTPLLLQVAFWKKLLLMLPLLILRVLGKILLKVFGKNALSHLMLRYSMLEQRFTGLVDRLQEFRVRAVAWWGQLGCAKRGYLVLIFLPLAVIILLSMLIIRIVRLKFLQMIIEKIMQAGMEKATQRMKANTDKENVKKP